MDSSFGAADMERLGGVLLEVRAGDPDLGAAVGSRQPQPAVQAEGLVVLGDLVPLGIVRVEVVLAVKDRALGDLAVEREPEQQRHLDRPLVRDRQRPRKRQADGAGARVRIIECADGAAAEHLRPGLQVDMDLEADHCFPTHLRRSGT